MKYNILIYMQAILLKNALFICYRRNKLQTLEENFFSAMPSLKIVNLELNEFSTIDEKIWGSVWSHMESLNIDCK